MEKSQVFKCLARIVAGITIVTSWGVQGFAPLSVLGADLKTIRERGYLIVAVHDGAAPMAAQDAQGEWQGFEIDIARRLAQTLVGQPEAVKFVAVRNADRLQRVMDDQVDLAIAQVTATQSRARLVHFTEPYYLNGISLITQNQPGKPAITQLRDLSKQPIAVLNQSSAITALQYHQPNWQIVGVEDYAAAQTKLAAGEVGAIAASTHILVGWAQQNPDYQLIPAQYQRQPIAIAYPKGLQYTDLATEVSESMRQWQREGWLKERAIYWGLPWDRLGE
jgi:polar amino acid transport system substrate-binding protein